MSHLLFWLRKNMLVSISVFLLLCSSYFFYGAESLRRQLRKSEVQAFNSGDIVQVIDVIDGDEMTVTTPSKDAKTVVRLLGIMALDPTREGHAGTVHFGQQAVDYLRSICAGHSAKLIMEQAQHQDKNGRLLAYVQIETDNGFDSDLGMQLIEKGLALVYTKYPTKREAKYLVAEQKAIAAGQGLWQDPKLKSTVLGWKSQWAEKRSQ